MGKPSFSLDDFEPPTPPTIQEIAFFTDVILPMSRDEIMARLRADVQTACEIELATIPIYLYTYYSLNRTQNSGENLDDETLFVNKAGGNIMSVAVEEMLHMSLASNLFYALFGEAPKLYGNSPGVYPTPLPNHKKEGNKGPDGSGDVSIPLGKFSYEQLWHFLQIENPGPEGLAPKDKDWVTIGQYYSYIRCLLWSPHITDEDFTGADFQIQPSNYSPNNVDTVSPKKKFNSWAAPGQKNSAAKAAHFPNAPDSHAASCKAPSTEKTELITISSRVEALIAIDTICDQGEGFNHGKFDDPSAHEQSHYYKFLSLQAQMQPYLQQNHNEVLDTPPMPPEAISPTINQSDLVSKGLIFNYPESPKLSSYPVEVQPIVEFINGLYQYMLIMTETIFQVSSGTASDPKNTQKYYFNIAMHRSMIWVMDKYIRTMNGLPSVSEGAYKGLTLAPTFEYVELGKAENSFSALKILGARASAVAKTLGSDYDNISYYIDVALTATFDGEPRHLPDVADYIQKNKLGTSPGQAGYPIPDVYPFENGPKFPTANLPLAQPEGSILHACMGLNSCKGQDVFGKEGPPIDPTNPNRPSGQNECAGQGFCSTAAGHTCHVQNACKGQGGCGLYGTPDELAKPGQNDCRSLGSCATPINAERFITNGEYQGESVWQRARAVFAENVWPELRKENPELPESPPEVGGKEFVQKNGDVFKNGPSYLWLSDDNQERGNFTACGNSGMSGAGGCS